jgi:hypothetical protein
MDTLPVYFLEPHQSSAGWREITGLIFKGDGAG